MCSHSSLRPGRPTEPRGPGCWAPCRWHADLWSQRQGTCSVWLRIWAKERLVPEASEPQAPASHTDTQPAGGQRCRLQLDPQLPGLSVLPALQPGSVLSPQTGSGGHGDELYWTTWTRLTSQGCPSAKRRGPAPGFSGPRLLESVHTVKLPSCLLLWGIFDSLVLSQGRGRGRARWEVQAGVKWGMELGKCGTSEGTK